jgi:hypothetical protein
VRNTAPALEVGAYPTASRASRFGGGTVPVGPENVQYQRLIDRLRHAEQYAEAAGAIAKEALSALETDDDVVAMMATVDERMVRRLGHAEQYAEAAALTFSDAIALLEGKAGQEDG